MLTNPEERKRLRQEKAARAQAQARKFRVRLIVAAVVLITCGVLILSLSRKPSAPEYRQNC